MQNILYLPGAAKGRNDMPPCYTMIAAFLGNGMINGSLIALTALGFALVYNTMKVFHIAFAGIYLWAGYVLYFFMAVMHWPLLPSVLMAIAAASILGVLCEALVYQKLLLKGRSHDAVMISSVGILIFLVSLVELIFGNSPLYIDFPYRINSSGIGMHITPFRLAGFIISSVAIVAFFFYMKHTRTGIRIRALRDDASLSSLYGVRVYRLKLILYLLSGIFVGIAACFNALDMGINPQLGIPVFINAFVALVIGGIGRFDGPVIGGLLLGVLQSLTELLFDSRWVMMATFILLIIFLIARPQGLLPEKTRAF